MTGTRTIGVLSDTHGQLRSELLRMFRGADLILHAGDVGDPAVLTELAVLAPLRAVWGNVDGWEVRREAAEEVEVEVNGRAIVVVHGHRGPGPGALARERPAADVVIHGHTHEPKIERREDGRLVLNPGSAGPKRFDDPVTAALLRVPADGAPRAEIRDLETGELWTGDEGGA